MLWLAATTVAGKQAQLVQTIRLAYHSAVLESFLLWFAQAAQGLLKESYKVSDVPELKVIWLSNDGLARWGQLAFDRTR